MNIILLLDTLELAVYCLRTVSNIYIYIVLSQHIRNIYTHVYM